MQQLQYQQLQSEYLNYSQNSTNTANTNKDLRGFRTVSSPTFFVNNAIRKRLSLENKILTHRISSEESTGLPLYIRVKAMNVHSQYNIDEYHSLTPLPSNDSYNDKKLRAQLYKVTKTSNNKRYILRKHNVTHITTNLARSSLAPWLIMQKSLTAPSSANNIHPGIVGIYDAFQSIAFNNTPCLCIIYDYHPGEISLEARYFNSNNSNLMFIPEDILWSYLCQMITSICSIHSANLSLKGCISLSKVLLTNQNRIKFSCAGLIDILNTSNAHKSLKEYQREDVLAIGQIILILACQNPLSIRDIGYSLKYVTSKYSNEFTKILTTILLSTPSLPVSCYDVLSKLSFRLMIELTRAYDSYDNIRNELAKEVENGRLLRLLIKLDMISDRPELYGNTQWSQTESRYLLKLFKDYVFHQNDSSGKPNLDYGHVIDSLNQLDVGTQEKILLMSRNQENMIIANYANLKDNIERSFLELQGIPPNQGY